AGLVRHRHHPRAAATGRAGVLPQPGGCHVHDLPDYLPGSPVAGPGGGGPPLRVGDPDGSDRVAVVPGVLGAARAGGRTDLAAPSDYPGTPDWRGHPGADDAGPRVEDTGRDRPGVDVRVYIV